MPADWQCLARRPVLDYPPFLRVELHTIRLPDGRVLRDWTWVVTPDYVNVVVVGADRRYLFFRQGKYALDRESLAPVGGYMEPGESALAAAQRELREEAGLRCREWHELGRFVVDANRGCGSGHFFLARAPEAVPRVESDDLEVQVPVWLTREEIETAIDAGDMGLMPWVSVVLLALRFEDRQG